MAAESKEVGPCITWKNEGEFLDFVKQQLGMSKCAVTRHLSQVWSLICSGGYDNYAAALLRNDIGLDVDVNGALIDEMRPLHMAAQYLSPPLVKLLLDHGAKTDMPTADGRLPLKISLEAISRHYLVADWTAEKSVWKLIYLLCLPDLLEPLEVAKLLTGNREEVQSVAEQCVENGNVVQLGALLMLAREKLLNTNNENDGLLIEQIAMKKLAQLHRMESLMIACGQENMITLCEQKRHLMLCVIQMLALYEQAGSSLEDYWRSEDIKTRSREFLAEKIFNLFEKNGFCLEEHVNFNVTNLGPEEERLKESIRAKLCSMRSAPTPVQLVSSQIPERLSAMCRQHGFPFPCLQDRQLHTCSRQRNTSGFRLFGLPLRTQVNRTACMVDPLSPTPMAKRFCAFALNITKRIRC